VSDPTDHPADRDIVHYFRDHAGEWRWQRVAANHKVVADSGEGYDTEPGVLAAIARTMPDLPIVRGRVGDDGVLREQAPGVQRDVPDAGDGAAP
jgi:uncharacterized protein YegP (UPF0339 family)